MWNHIRKKISLTPCQSFYAGSFSSAFSFVRFWISTSLVDFAKSFVIFEVTGTGASAAIFTNSSDLKDLYHHMILLTSTLILMLKRSLTFHCLCYSWPLTLQTSFDADAFSILQWVSHRNHRGNICGVDFIWLLNPNSYRKLLKTSWRNAIFSMFKVKIIFSFPLVAGRCAFSDYMLKSWLQSIPLWSQ